MFIVCVCVCVGTVCSFDEKPKCAGTNVSHIIIANLKYCYPSQGTTYKKDQIRISNEAGKWILLSYERTTCSSSDLLQERMVMKVCWRYQCWIDWSGIGQMVEEESLSNTESNQTNRLPAMTAQFETWLISRASQPHILDSRTLRRSWFLVTLLYSSLLT